MERILFVIGLFCLAVGCSPIESKQEAADTMAAVFEDADTIEVDEAPRDTSHVGITSDKTLLRLPPAERLPFSKLTPEVERDTSAMQLLSRMMNMYDYCTTGQDYWYWVDAVHQCCSEYSHAHSIRLSPQRCYDLMVEIALAQVADYRQGGPNERNSYAEISERMTFYRVVDLYQQTIGSTALDSLEHPAVLRELLLKEYSAWNAWARSNVRNGSLRLMAENRLRELRIERSILCNGYAYKQKGTTPTQKMWDEWKYQNVKDETDAKTVALFERWMSIRHKINKELPRSVKESYDYMTADIHSRYVGTLKPLVGR